MLIYKFKVKFYVHRLWVSYRAGTWLIDECQIAFFMSCLMLRVCTHLFCRYFQCHLSYHQQFVWYLG